MQFRRWINVGSIFAAAIVGGLLPPDLVTSQAARISATFLGLFAAGILPTISLLLQSVNSTGKSVFRIDELESEITDVVDELFKILGAAGFATFVLLTLSINTPPVLSILQTEGALSRLGHALVGASIAFTILKAGHIPSIIRNALKIRFAQARYEARQSTLDNAPDDLEIKSAFPRKKGFGEIHKLNDENSS